MNDEIDAVYAALEADDLVETWLAPRAKMAFLPLEALQAALVAEIAEELKVMPAPTASGGRAAQLIASDRERLLKRAMTALKKARLGVPPKR